jgi:transmembrane 9 superfamily protein 2/4
MRINVCITQLKFMEDQDCKVLCPKQVTDADVDILRQRVAEESRVLWYIDDLPAAQRVTKQKGPDNEYTAYEIGFPLGKYEKGTDGKELTNVLRNHVHLKISYTTMSDGTYRIVFFEVVAESIDYKNERDEEKIKSACKARSNSKEPLSLISGGITHIGYTYSVEWLSTKTEWSARWNNYLSIKEDGQIHWFSIVNSLMIVLFLSGMVAMIMMRTLHADFRRYNSDDPEEADETGWKLVHGDVFRPPARPMVFSVLVGSGIQMLGMVMVTLIFAVLGFLSPANRGGLMSAGLVLYVWMGALAGYFSTRTYKMFKGQNWKKNTLATAFGFSGTIFGIFFVLNFFVLGAKSSAAIPVGTFFALLALWTGISLPLTFLGSYFAWRKTPPEQPVRTNQIPREIPDQVWYMNPFFSIMMGGILPFGAVFIELFFILSSVWSHQFYYLFSFLFLVFLILIITCAEISIVMCYFQLCSEDYNWWWRSYLTSGASAIYMFCYSIFYFTYLDITSFTSIVWYFGYSLVMSIIFFVMTGAIGYTSSYFFVRKIYSNIKFD